MSTLVEKLFTMIYRTTWTMKVSAICVDQEEKKTETAEGNLLETHIKFHEPLVRQFLNTPFTTSH